MLFNSLSFAFFFLVVYGLYLVLGHRWQNRMLLLASCVFYGAWDWRFLFLMFVSITTDFLCGRSIARSGNVATRKRYVALGVCVNLGILGFFKYFNFFAENFAVLIGRFGFSGNLPVLNIILPIGISFYTFQSMSYLVDVYRKEVEPVKSYSEVNWSKREDRYRAMMSFLDSVRFQYRVFRDSSGLQIYPDSFFLNDEFHFKKGAGRTRATLFLLDSISLIQKSYE